MRNKKNGLATALLCLCLCLLVLSGCSASTPLYTAGLTEETAEDTAEGGTEPDADGTETVSGAWDGSATDSAGTRTVNTEAAADTSQAEATSNSPGISDTLAGLEASVEEASQTEASQTEAIAGYVYVCGAVNEPGVYPILADMRVCDAVRLAGGFSPEADEEWLNQAAALADGQKLYIYTVEETDLMRESGMIPEGMSGSTSGADASGISGSAGGTASAAAGASADDSAAAASAAGALESGTSPDGKININTATREELMTLPGIGESKADAIVSYRDIYGAFASIEEIQNISGIKSGVFSQIKDLITV